MFYRARTIESAVVTAGVVIAAVMCIASGVRAEVTMQTVVVSGEHAPGTETEVTFTSDMRDVAVNGSGQVSFQAFLDGPGISYRIGDRGVWSGNSAGTRLIARSGQQAPGEAVGTDFWQFGRTVINGAGQVAFEAVGTTAAGGSTDMLYIDSGGGPVRLAGRYQQAPGAPAGVAFNSFDYQLQPAFNTSGQAAFNGMLVRSGGVDQYNDEGIWVMGGGAAQLRARGGDQAAPFTTDWDYWRFEAPYINAHGGTVFRGLQINDGTGFYAIWSDGAHNMWPVAYMGMQVPGMATGVYFNSLPSEMGFNNAGDVLFQGEMGGTGIDGANNDGIWVGSGFGLTLVAREGAPAPGTSGNFQSIDFSAPSLNGAGEVAFSASISGANDSAIWAGKPGALDLIAREGVQAPGLPEGVQFDYLIDPAINNTGAVAFFAVLRGAGVSEPNNGSLWAQAGDELFLVAREGDDLEVRPGVTKTIDGIEFVHRVGNEDGRPSAFNDMGQVAMILNFTDDSSGVFLATVTGSGRNTQLDPIVPSSPTPGPDGAWTFTGVSGDGQWFDPPAADSYIYETDGASNFTQVGLPTGLGDADGLYTITDSVNGSVVVGAGEIHTFPTAVDLFTVTGIDPDVDGGDPLAFPTFLAFDQLTVTFTQTPTPEPATLSLLALGAVAVLKRRRPKL
jgi:hypothetical protein